MRAFFIGCIVATSAVVAFGWVAGCTSNIKPPLAENDNPDAVAYVPPDPIGSSNDAGTDAPSIDAPAPIVCTAAPAGGCNSAGLCGDKIFVVGSATNAPPGTGGVIAAGTYNLVASTAYNVSGIPPGLSASYWFQQTFFVSPAATVTVDAGAPSEDGGLEGGAASEDSGPKSVSQPFEEAAKDYGDPLTNISGALVSTGTKLSLEYTCGDTTYVSGPYSANAGSFTLYLAEPGGGVLSEVYELQQ